MHIQQVLGLLLIGLALGTSFGVIITSREKAPEPSKPWWDKK